MKKRFVVKLGSNILIKDGCFNFSVIVNLAENVLHLKNLGHDVVIVSSGAIAAGQENISLTSCPGEIDPLVFDQMCSCIGQAHLMERYIGVFSEYRMKVAQALITQDVFINETFRTSFVNMLNGLLKIGVVPVVNENDSIETTEIVFSDNDMLAAHLAVLLEADALVLLSNVEGLCHKHPDDGGEVIPVIDEITDETYGFVNVRKSTFGRGGMKSKIETASFMMGHNIPMYLASGERRDALIDIASDKHIGTLFRNRDDAK